MNFFEWPSIRANLISELIFFVFVAITIPPLTIWLIRSRNRKSLILKFSHILLELCDFLSYTNYRHKDLNAEHVEIFTKRTLIKEYKFVAISIVNVFNRVVYPTMFIVIHEIHSNKTIMESYEILKSELSRMKELRITIEQLLSAHALYLDEKLQLEISELCFLIRKFEVKHKSNTDFEELSKATGSPMTGVFGLKEVDEIYQSIFRLIKNILERNYFDFNITSQTTP